MGKLANWLLSTRLGAFLALLIWGIFSLLGMLLLAPLFWLWETLDEKFNEFRPFMETPTMARASLKRLQERCRTLRHNIYRGYDEPGLFGCPPLPDSEMLICLSQDEEIQRLARQCVKERATPSAIVAVMLGHRPSVPFLFALKIRRHHC